MKDVSFSCLGGLIWQVCSFDFQVREFIQDVGAKLPVYGVDVPARVLAQISLLPGDWVDQDENWKHVQQLLSTDRFYASVIRNALLQEWHVKKSTHVFMYSLKEHKVCPLPYHASHTKATGAS